MTESNTPPAPPPAPPRCETPALPREVRDEIMELKKQGYGKRKIAERTGHSSREVVKVLREEGLLAPPGPTAASKLEPFLAEISARVQQDLTTSRILREIRELGYQGGRTILAERVARLRTQLTLDSTRPTKRRFETAPGEEIQIDFSPYSVRVGGRLVRVHAFAVLLCYSRKLYLRLFREERTSTVLEGLAGAFEYFDGVARRVVMDNMVQAVLGRVGKDREVLWQPRLLECARHYGFEPVACAVRDPDRKGKDEKVFRLVWDDLLKGTDFDSWEDLERRCRAWLDQIPGVGNLRVHGTTRRVPNEVWETEERALLIRLPDARFAGCENDVREVDRDSTLSIRGTRYSVPEALASSSVAVRLFADHFEILDRKQRVAFSRRYVPDSQKGTVVIDPTHYATLPRRPKDARSGRLDEAFLDRFPELAPLVDGLKRRFKTLAPIQLRSLLRLCDRWGRDAFVAAATRSQEYRRFDAGAVERILERDCPLPPEADPEPPLNGAGAAVLGEVDAPSLDVYRRLDEGGSSPKDPAQPDPVTVTDSAKKGQGGDHGA
jgi:transposase